MLIRRDDVVRRFAETCRLDDIAGLRAALDADAVAVCDGGPVPVAHGAEQVARLVAIVLCGEPDAELTVEAVNGRAGLALRRAGRAVAVIAVEVAGNRVAVLWMVLNPAKLRGWHHR
jgi:RNA polymerase sigma-70 factor (ECF subfamily)